MRKVLVTAFEPFGGDTVNASWEAAKRVDGFCFDDAVVAARMLACAFEICLSEFAMAFERLGPCAVLMTGQAARRGSISVERFARRRASGAAPDNCGRSCAALASGPDVAEATVSARAVTRAIQEAGYVARVSDDAGCYVCNHLYYNALRYLAARSPATSAIFVHLPATPTQSPPLASRRRLTSADAACALQAAAGALLRGVDTSNPRPRPVHRGVQQHLD